MLSKKARNEGIKVLLSGAGGDEIFGGYNRHFPRSFGTASWIANLPKPARDVSRVLLGFAKQDWKFRFKNAARNFTSNISGVNFSTLRQLMSDSTLYEEMLRRIDARNSILETKATYPLMKADLEDYLPNNVLMLTDKATMAASVEGRVPLLDHRIIEFAFSIPEEKNLLNKEPKGLFKKAVADFVPQSVINRSKEGFNAPVNEWVVSWPSVIREELLGNRSALLGDILDAASLEKHVSNKKMLFNGASTFYALFLLNKWLNVQSTRQVTVSA